MKIPKSKFNEWAHDYAMKETPCIQEAQKLSLIEAAAMKHTIEQAVLRGMEIVEKLRTEGYDTTEAVGLETYLTTQHGAAAPAPEQSNTKVTCSSPESEAATK